MASHVDAVQFLIFLIAFTSGCNNQTKAFQERDWKTPTIKRQIENHVSWNGIDGLGNMIINHVKTFKVSKLNLALTGQTGSGKSSLINTLRGLKAGDSDAARVGVVETTSRIDSYSHPNLPRYTLFDLPGVNSPRFPHHAYADLVRIDSYDGLVICSQARFTESDLQLVQIATQHKIPYIFVRTHLDVDLRNAQDDEGDTFDDQIVISRIFKNIQSNLEDYGVPDNAIFLISNKHKYQWDFPKLSDYLQESFPKAAESAFATKTINIAKMAIKRKSEHLYDRIDKVASQAALAHATFGSGEKQIDEEHNRIVEELGLPRSYRRRVRGTEVAGAVATHGVLGGAAYWFLGPVGAGIGFLVTSSLSYITSKQEFSGQLHSAVRRLTKEAITQLERDVNM